VNIPPLILALVAILLIVLFVWLLLRESNARAAAKKAVEAKPVVAPMKMAEAKPVAPVVGPPPAVSTPAVKPAVLVEPEPTPIPVVEAKPVPAPAAVAEEPAKSVGLPAADDLVIIEGIGPKIADVLKQAGVTTFAQLAAMDPARIHNILQAANLRLADPKSWPEQARLAAAGDQAGLKALQDRLKGGREV
jgi:predicted flap endonuclease-1-like 5' DNA nuclease